MYMYEGLVKGRFGAGLIPGLSYSADSHLRSERGPAIILQSDVTARSSSVKDIFD